MAASPNSDGGKAVGIVAGVIVLLAAGGGGWWYYQRGKAPVENPPATAAVPVGQPAVVPAGNPNDPSPAPQTASNREVAVASPGAAAPGGSAPAGSYPAPVRTSGGQAYTGAAQPATTYPPPAPVPTPASQQSPIPHPGTQAAPQRTEDPVPLPAPSPSPEPAPPANQRPPSQPAYAPPPEPQRREPAPVAPQRPIQAAPASGVMTWSGKLQKNGSLVIDGGAASFGNLNGALPGVPVIVEIEPKDIGVAESPGPGNGWRRLVLRSRADRNIVVTVRWRTIGQ
jgi:hypothetical protein